MDSERYLAAVNRLYYAAFYVVSAYFASQNVLVKSHKGMNVKLYDELVLKQLINKTDGQTFEKLLKLRGEADYADFVVISTCIMKEIFRDTVAFINKIESLINTNE